MTQYTSPLPIIAQAIWDGHAILGTDGSVRHGVATYAWVLSTTDLLIEADVKGGGFLPPTARYADPYSKRPEAAALYAALKWLQQILTMYPDQNPHLNPTPTIPIPMDNQSVLDDLKTQPDHTTPTYHFLHPDYDIIQAIHTLIPQLPIKINLHHVKSHQDRNNPTSNLHPHAQINILADAHANDIHSMPPHTTGLFPTWVPNTKAALFHGNQQVTSKLPDYLRTAAHAPALREYLIDRSQTATGRDVAWTDDTFDTIAWSHLGQAIRPLAHGQKIQVSKLMNDLLPTRRQQQTLDNTMDGRCFACSMLWEDMNHILCCNNDSRIQSRTAAIQTFRQHLVTQHTPDIMTTLICDSMSNWLQRTQVHPPTWDTPLEPIQLDLQRAFDAQ